MSDQNKSTEPVTLDDLVGEHELSGCDEISLRDTESLCFVLDGKTYAATEDPCDGYRSCMGTLEVSDAPVGNRFPPCRVVCSMDDEVLEMKDVTTGEVVLRVGTDNSCDYYPYFVGSFNPTAMACNKAAP